MTMLNHFRRQFAASFLSLLGPLLSPLISQRPPPPAPHTGPGAPPVPRATGRRCASFDSHRPRDTPATPGHPAHSDFRSSRNSQKTLASSLKLRNRQAPTHSAYPNRDSPWHTDRKSVV